MGFETIKSVSKSVGLYRTARWVNRHLMQRGELQRVADECRQLSAFVGKGDLCFDVGANYGSKTEVLLRLGARVVAFEPQPECLAELHHRLGRPKMLTTVGAAVGAKQGQATLFVHQHRTCSSLLQGWEGAAETSIRVPVTTLDAAIAEHGSPRYIKIDVEGFELEVLKGLSQRVDVVSFEFHQEDDGLKRAVACLRRLAEFGPLSINVAGAEQADFVCDEWWNLAEFEPYLLTELPKLSGFGYGDIFVRIAA